MSSPPFSSGSGLTRRLSQTFRLTLKRGISTSSRKSTATNSSGEISPPLPTPSKELAGFFHPSMMAPSSASEGAAHVPSIVVEHPHEEQENTPPPTPATSNAYQSGLLRRSKSSIKRQKRREETEDQRHEREWQQRARSSAGHFDLNIKLCPDTSAMVNAAVVGERIVPSSLSTFAPRGPLVIRKD